MRVCVRIFAKHYFPGMLGYFRTKTIYFIFSQTIFYFYLYNQEIQQESFLTIQRNEKYVKRLIKIFLFSNHLSLVFHSFAFIFK